MENDFGSWAITLIRHGVKISCLHFLLLLMSIKFDNIFTSYVINWWHHSSLSFIKDRESLNFIPCLEKVRWGNWSQEIYKPLFSHLSWKHLPLKATLYVTHQYELKFLNPKNFFHLLRHIFLRDCDQILFLMLSELIIFH